MIPRRAAQSMLPSSKPLPQRGRRAAAIPSGAKCLRALRIGFEGKDPAPGYRGYGEGALRDVGVSGFSWSSTIPEGSDNAHYLLFYYSFLARMASKTPNGCGFQLRCLQE